MSSFQGRPHRGVPLYYEKKHIDIPLELSLTHSPDNAIFTAREYLHVVARNCRHTSGGGRGGWLHPSSTQVKINTDRVVKKINMRNCRDTATNIYDSKHTIEYINIMEVLVVSQ
jgi:hypothetical protein